MTDNEIIKAWECCKKDKFEPNADSPHGRLLALYEAHERGINTWISAEPVLNDEDVLLLIKNAEYVDLWKIGKLNYHPSDIDWGEFGRRAERALKNYGRNYYIKESLRAEMENDNAE